jgi:hypothetical protein
MEIKTAIEILEYHQEWRLGKREDMIHEPKKLTQALDIVLSKVKKLPIQNVSKRRGLLIAYCTHILDECTDEDKITIDAFLEKYFNRVVAINS